MPLVRLYAYTLPGLHAAFKRGDWKGAGEGAWFKIHPRERTVCFAVSHFGGAVKYTVLPAAAAGGVEHDEEEEMKKKGCAGDAGTGALWVP